MKTWLLDTGPIVAFLDGTDEAHAPVSSVITKFNGRLVTTSAVITETMHLVSEVDHGPETLAQFITASGALVLDLCQPAELRTAAEMMRNYRKVPMDFADATLMLVSEALDVRDILTLDRRGFTVFRDRRGRALRLVSIRG